MDAKEAARRMNESDQNAREGKIHGQYAAVLEELRERINFLERLTESQAKTLQTVSATNVHLIEMNQAKDSVLIDQRNELTRRYAKAHQSDKANKDQS